MRKAIELGAPIEILPNYTEYRVFPLVKCKDGNERPCVIPTAEQMIGWLRTKNIHIVIHKDIIDKWSTFGHEIEPIAFTVFDRLTGYNSFEEAVITAIDAALDYLTNHTRRI